ncbi:MAG: hypothetical protein AYK19_15925 [Theionarchaea archaeon DG-70-1]|nr:MAG: hypothetical protein AYK19_15925 [Theionarchaea archaeon DG-70-1]
MIDDQSFKRRILIDLSTPQEIVEEIKYVTGVTRVLSKEESGIFLWGDDAVTRVTSDKFVFLFARN